MKKNKWMLLSLPIMVLLLFSSGEGVTAEESTVSTDVQEVAQSANKNDDVTQKAEPISNNGVVTETQVGFIEGDKEEPKPENPSIIGKPLGRLPSTGELVTAGVSIIGLFMFASFLLIYKFKKRGVKK